MGINSYADIIHQNTSSVTAGNWWMRDGVEKSVFITSKLNHRPLLCSVSSVYIFYMVKTSLPVFWVVGYSEEKFP